MKIAQRLSREVTRGTMTFFFPHNTAEEMEAEERPPLPQVTLMVSRPSENEWTAGIAVCSQKEAFNRPGGRVIAHGRLTWLPREGKKKRSRGPGRPFRADNPRALLGMVAEEVNSINQIFPGTIDDMVFLQLGETTDVLRGMRTEAEFAEARRDRPATQAAPRTDATGE